MPGDIVVVDNAPAHRNNGGNALSAFLDMFDIEYIFTPTYSPDMNPVEKAFAQLRKILIQKEFKPLVETKFGICNLQRGFSDTIFRL